MPDTLETPDCIRDAQLFDSREITERIEELKAQDERDETERDELRNLEAIAEEGEAFADWPYGEAFIREDYFTEYAQQLAEDIGAINADAAWPATCIDWNAAADALKMDYSTIEIGGHTYYARRS